MYIYYHLTKSQNSPSTLHVAFVIWPLVKEIVFQQIQLKIRVWEICESCELLVTVSCESLRVVTSYLSLGVSPTFVAIALLLPANYRIFQQSRT